MTRQARLEASLKQALLNRTITFARVVLLQSDVNWLTEPPEVRLNVRTKEVLTPTQVRLLEEFLEKETGQKFTLIFEAGQVEEVRREKLIQPDSEPTP